MKGGEKTLILSNKDSNISFYLYKIIKQYKTYRTFYFIFILNVRPFLYGNFFFLPKASSICLFNLMNGGNDPIEERVLKVGDMLTYFSSCWYFRSCLRDFCMVLALLSYLFSFLGRLNR